MKPKFVNFLVVVALAALSTPAVAQVQDHLTCFKTRDIKQVKYALDMLALKQPEFTVKGCIVAGRSVTFCVPTTKILRDPNKPAANLPGSVIDFDYVQFKIRCPNAVGPPRKLVTDQLAGSRVITFGPPVTILVPATKQRPPCAPVAARICGGDCPAGEACVPDAADQGCNCQPPPKPCGIDAAGVCGGDCSATPNTKCEVRLDLATNQSICACFPPVTGCGLVPGTSQCSGQCPNPGDQCQTFVSTAGVTCDCAAPPPTCAPDAATGQCGGTCPAGQTCKGGAGVPCACG
jgi:hypothetical protein